MKGKIYILNSPIMPDNGVYVRKNIDRIEAKEILKNAHNEDIVSAIGHKGTAEYLSLLLDTNIEANRIAINMRAGDKAIVFRLKDRLPEGYVLNKEELDKFEYELLIVEKIADL